MAMAMAIRGIEYSAFPSKVLVNEDKDARRADHRGHLGGWLDRADSTLEEPLFHCAPAIRQPAGLLHRCIARWLRKLVCGNARPCCTDMQDIKRT